MSTREPQGFTCAEVVLFGASDQPAMFLKRPDPTFRHALSPPPKPTVYGPRSHSRTFDDRKLLLYSYCTV